jgi:NTP pyrophosphatase (non-canonical NTP hydrolase)
MDQLIKKVIAWGRSKNLLHDDIKSNQIIKINEEVGELCRAYLKNDRDDMKDAYGDILVTLILSAYQNNFELVECLESAYNVIKDRKGKLINNTFIKE